MKQSLPQSADNEIAEEIEEVFDSENQDYSEHFLEEEGDENDENQPQSPNAAIHSSFADALAQHEFHESTDEGLLEDFEYAPNADRLTRDSLTGSPLVRPTSNKAKSFEDNESSSEEEENPSDSSESLATPVSQKRPAQENTRSPEEQNFPSPGTYFASKSGRLGTLSGTKHRPNFGSPLFSPATPASGLPPPRASPTSIPSTPAFDRQTPSQIKSPGFMASPITSGPQGTTKPPPRKGAGKSPAAVEAPKPVDYSLTKKIVKTTITENREYSTNKKSTTPGKIATPAGPIAISRSEAPSSRVLSSPGVEKIHRFVHFKTKRPGPAAVLGDAAPRDFLVISSLSSPSSLPRGDFLLEATQQFLRESFPSPGNFPLYYSMQAHNAERTAFTLFLLNQQNIIKSPSSRSRETDWRENFIRSFGALLDNQEIPQFLELKPGEREY